MADLKNKPAPQINYAGGVMLPGEVYGGREEWGAHDGVLGKSEVVRLVGPKGRNKTRTPGEYLKNLMITDPEKMREVRRKASDGLKRYWAEVKAGKRKRTYKR